MDEILETGWGMLWKFMLLVVLVQTGVHFAFDTNIKEVTKAYAEMTAVSGGFTSSQMTQLREELRLMGYDPNKLVISVTATTPDGKDISSKAINVTPPSTNYTSPPKFCPRGTKITLEVYSTERSGLNGIFSMLGLNDSNIRKGYSKKVYMSERIE